MRQASARQFSQLMGDLVPLVDHPGQWHSGFDVSRDLVQHELEVTPRTVRLTLPPGIVPRGLARVSCPGYVQVELPIR